MNSTFGTRLFRLFLLFALIPAIIVAAVGYYVASEKDVVPSSVGSEKLKEYAEYYGQLFADRTASALDAFIRDPSRPSAVLDFVIRGDDSSVSYRSPAIAEIDLPSGRLLEASSGKARGFVESQGRYFQYCRAEDSRGQVHIGGVVHGADYARALQAIQTDYAGASVRRTLISNYLYFLAIVFLTVAAITALAAYYFSARLSRNLASPLAALSEASKKIADGDFEQRVESGGVGEVTTLIDNFNRMAGQLGLTSARLAQSERVAAWRQVARRFAHELKNPLQPMLVSLYRIETQLKDSAEYDKVKQPLAAASEELKHLTQLADRFSQLAKLPDPTRQETNMNDLLKSVAELYREQLSQFDFILDLPAQPCLLSIDPTYFREAVHNLLQNAAEASSPGGRIVLRMTEPDERVVVQVQDFGIGMTPQTAAAARMPYFTTRDKGTGLGLAVVEKIVNDHGGTMIIESTPGQGTTVNLDMPAKGDYDRSNSDS